MHSEGWFVCLCVPVTMFSATMCKKTATNQCQQIQRFTGLIVKLAIFVKYCIQELAKWTRYIALTIILSILCSMDESIYLDHDAAGFSHGLCMLGSISYSCIIIHNM